MSSLGFTVAAAVLIFSAFAFSRADAAFDPNSIIADSYMTASGTMSEAQIQSFLEQKGSYLANYYETRHSGIGPNDNIDSYGWRASRTIWQAANWYGINPQVILASLQKEQSLITNPTPASWALDWAMGYGCPDSSACGSYPGFSRQVDMGTWQLWYNMHYANLRDSRVAPYLTGNTISIDNTSVYLGNGATASLYRYTPHFQGNQNFYNICDRWFGFDAPPPPPPPVTVISNLSPADASTTSNNEPIIYAAFSGLSIIAGNTVVNLDGADVSAAAIRTAAYASYRPRAPLGPGAHSVSLTVTNSAGETKTASWSFTVSQVNYAPSDYYWSWYDGVGSSDWVLIANPTSASGSLGFNVSIAGRPMDLSSFSLSGSGCPGSGSCATGQVPTGRTLVTNHSGVRGGPIDAMSLTGGKAVASQRILWGEDSLEEVPATDGAKLSDHYFWTWYDNQSPGYTDWVLVANPNAASIYCEIRVGGQLRSSDVVQPGRSITPTFPGMQGGPVEVQAWTTSSKTAPASVIASQRVLSAGGAAFNEVLGIPAAELSDHYLWTWYDNQSPDSTDWVMVNNQNASAVYYEIKVADMLKDSGVIQAGATITPTFPGLKNGPVKVQAWTDLNKQAPAKVIASQRIVWGPSFEETPGYRADNLKSSYIWTWYDNQSPGSLNWVMVSNPNSVPIYFEARVAGTMRVNGMIQPGANDTHTFPGIQGGPVEVQAWTDYGKQVPMNFMTSQRVLWHGHFNEVAGAPAGG